MSLKPAYMQSGLSLLYESYVSILLFSSLSAFIVVVISGALLQYFLLGLAFTQLIMATLTLGIIAALSVAIVFVLYPLN